MIVKTGKNILSILTTRCDEASRLLSKSQDVPLSRVERWAVYLHLVSCRICRKYKRQLKLMRDLMANLADPQSYEAPSPPLLNEKQRQRLKQRILGKAQKKLNSL